MTNVSAWSVTAGLNNSSPPDGWPEGMARSGVNDCAREMMAALAKWYKTSHSALTTGGAGNAYTLTTGAGYTSYADVPMLVFMSNRVNTGPITLNVDGIGARSVFRNAGDTYNAFAANDVASGQVMVVVWNNPGDWFDYIGPAVEGFDHLTRMLFQQTAAPSGWTKDTSSHNDKTLRLVTGPASSGGSSPFSTVFATRTISVANLPVTTLPSFTLNAADHQHGSGTYGVNSTLNPGTNITRGLSFGTDSTLQGGGGRTALSSASFSSDTVGLTAGNVVGSSGFSGALAVTGTINLGGSGTGMNFNINYADAIIAAKT